MTSLKKQTISGIKWLVGASFVVKLISVLTTIILARILNPSIFGLFALAFAAINAFGLFKSMGFDSALIKRKEDLYEAANTAFFIIPSLGILLFITISFFSPFIGKMLNNIEIINVIRALGIIFIFQCFSKVPLAILEKNMQFNKISFIDIIIQIVFSLVSIVLASFGFGVWSLVIGYIARVFIGNILAWSFCDWRPQVIFNKKIAFEMFNFGKFIFLGATVSFLRMNLDNILVGKLLGVTALGLYAVAFNISNFGADYFAGKIQRVTFPAYSKLHGNLEHLQKAFLKILKHTSLIALPLGIGLFLLAEDFIRLFYGEKWIGATSILKILSCLGTFNTLLTALVGIFLGIGKPRLYFLINLLQVIIFVMFISPAAKIFGLNGIGVVVGLSSFIAFFLASVLVIRLLSLNFNQLYPNLKPALLSTLMMVIGIVISKKILSYNNSILLPYYTFPLLIIIGIIFYSVTLSKIEKPIFKEIKEILVS